MNKFSSRGSILSLIKFEFRRRLLALSFIIATAVPILSATLGIVFAKNEQSQEEAKPYVVPLDSSINISQASIDTINLVLQMAAKSTPEHQAEQQQKEIDKSIDSANKLVTIGLTLIIYLFLIFYGIQILQCVLEEKINRMAEILLTAISPIKLLFGKIVAIGLVGLLQIGIWLSMVFIFIKYQEWDASANINQMLNLPSNFDWSDLPVLSPVNIIFLILMFLLGYLFYAALFTCLGTSIDSVTDSSQSSTLILTPIIISIIVSMEVINGESGLLIDLCTYLPFTSPIVLLVQVANGIALWKAIISLLILIGSTLITLKMSVKVYKRGMIHYGSKITFKQMLQWIRRD